MLFLWHTAPDDYVNSTSSLTFGPGTTTQQVSVPIEDDDLLEAIETFFGNIRFPAGGDSFDSIMFAPSTASATITDNEGECICTLDIPESVTRCRDIHAHTLFRFHTPPSYWKDIDGLQCLLR